MPTTPHTTVSQNGMLSRWPGARNFPSEPMITPPTRVTMIVQSMGLPFRWSTEGAARCRSLTDPAPAGTRLHGPYDAVRAERSAAEADVAGRARAELDVGDLLRRDEHLAALDVGQAEQAAGGERVSDLLLDGLGRLVGLQDQLALRVLDADLDLHGNSFLWLGVVQCSSVFG